MNKLKLFIVLGTLGMVLGVGGLWWVTTNPPREPVPVLYQLPEFELTGQDGEPFGTADLRGKTWIADFVFTSCGTVCPKLSKRMAEIQSKTGDDVRLVSFSVDPERDTPEVLADYGREYGADFQRWTFLTGELGQVKETIVKGFKQPMEPEVPHNVDDVNLYAVAHGIRFVLVDSNLAVRGFYESDDAGLELLLEDIDRIRAESN